MRLIDIDDDRNCYIGMDGEYETWNIDPNVIADAQPEPYKEKLNEIASALSEKFAYMNTCLNERDIILGYLGVKWSGKSHCNTDCTNIKCESHPSFAQPEIIRCKGCIYFDKGYDEDTADWCHAWSETTSEDGYCHNAERGEVQEWKT